MTSSECKKYINRYIFAKDKIQNAINYFDGCSDSILKSSSYLKDIIVNGKTFDEDKLAKDNDKLNDAKRDLQTIINECNEKIEYYEKLYREALNKEKAATESASDDSSSEKTSTKSTSVKSSVNKEVDLG